MPPDVKKPPAVRAEIVDRPDLTETFSDAIGAFSFDGQTMRIEFLVTRVGPGSKPNSPVVRAIPVSRMVLTPRAAADLANRLRGLSAEILKRVAKARDEVDTVQGKLE